ncbi:MAG: glycosyltransferase [Anaerolineae bacterium]|nr:glycosyltransferase [Anaerolineae bacterium]
MKHRWVWLLLIVGGDVGLITGIHLLLLWLRYGMIAHWFPASTASGSYTLWLILTLLVAGVMLTIAGAYRLPQPFSRVSVSARLLRVIVGHIFMITLLVYLLKLRINPTAFSYSRFVVGGGWLFMFFALALWRLAIGRLQRALFRRGWATRRVAVMGPAAQAQLLIDGLQRRYWLGDQAVGLFVTDSEPFANTQFAAALPMFQCATLQEATDLAAKLKIERIWLAMLPDEAAEQLLQLLDAPSLPVTWAIDSSGFERCLPLLIDKLAIDNSTEQAEALMTQLLKRVSHEQEPLAFPRIAFVGLRGIPASYGGIERYVEELSVRLARLGYRVAVYCRPHYSQQRGQYKGVTLRHLPCLNTKHLETISHTALATLHLLFMEDDIVHYQALGPSLLVWLPRLCGHKTVVTVQGADWQRAKWGPVAKTVLKTGEWAAVHLPHQTIAVSCALQQYYRQQYQRQVVYIPNGVNRAVPQPPHYIRTLGLKTGNYILTVGRLTPEKGYHTLIQAYRRINTDKMLVIAGGSSHTAAYVDQLHRLAHGASIIFTGYVYKQTLAELYSNAYLFVSASEVEGLPLTLLEALSFGVKVLASDIPAHQEVLSGHQHTFRAGSQQSLTMALQLMLNASKANRVTAAELHPCIVDRYSWKRVTEDTERLYQTLLASH